MNVLIINEKTEMNITVMVIFTNSKGFAFSGIWKWCWRVILVISTRRCSQKWGEDKIYVIDCGPSNKFVPIIPSACWEWRHSITSTSWPLYCKEFTITTCTCKTFVSFSAKQCKENTTKTGKSLGFILACHMQNNVVLY
jgi:hypothetical protein